MTLREAIFAKRYKGQLTDIRALYTKENLQIIKPKPWWKFWRR